ncbi:hypothetical protein BY458DRAFT_530992 [Sporodiniella umbellata]|nr:hypothetical protein BY458DRAFT_530992 [Sporodiniella umbellata]
MASNFQNNMNPHFEQTSTPFVYPNSPYVTRDNLPSYGQATMNMPEPYPTMPQVPNYGSLVQPTPPPDIVQAFTLKEKPAVTECFSCHRLVQTVTDYESGLCTGLSVILFYMIGCHNGGCLLPFMFPWTKNITHSCPACQEKIATFKRLERHTQVHQPIPVNN